MVIRGGFGVFFDRLNGNTVYNQVGNPPIGISTNVRNGNLQTLQQSGLVTQTPSSMTVFYYDSKLPTSLQWNIGTQMTLPWSSSLDISYVGSHAYNILGQNPDVNSPDLGVAYLAQNQDPTLSSTVPGGAAVTTDLLRPYRGLGGITTTWGKNWNGYDSIQMSLNRRFRDGVQATFNYTRSLRTIGNTGAQLRLQHNADGTFQVRDDQEVLDELMRDTGNRPHVIRANFVWELPGISTDSVDVEGCRRHHQRLAALGRLHRHVRHDVRFDLLVQRERRQRQPDGLAELRGAHQDGRRSGQRLLGQSVRAVQHRGVCRADLQQPGPGIGFEPPRPAASRRSRTCRSPATFVWAAAGSSSCASTCSTRSTG